MQPPLQFTTYRLSGQTPRALPDTSRLISRPRRKMCLKAAVHRYPQDPTGRLTLTPWFKPQCHLFGCGDGRIELGFACTIDIHVGYDGAGLGQFTTTYAADVHRECHIKYRYLLGNGKGNYATAGQELIRQCLQEKTDTKRSAGNV